MTRTRSLTSVIPVLALALGVGACAGEGLESGSGQEDVVASVLDEVKVLPDRLVFKKGALGEELRGRIGAYALAKRDGKEPAEKVILVDGRSKESVTASGIIRENADNPMGFIRRAVEVIDTGKETIVMTEPATLIEALEELEANGTMAFGPSAEGFEQKNWGGEYTARYETVDVPPITLSGIDVYERDENLIRIERGLLNISLTPDASAEISVLTLKDAHVAVSADFHAELDYTFKFASTVTQSFTREVYNEMVPVAGGGPLTITAGVQVNLNCEVDAYGTMQDGKTSVLADWYLDAGVRYTEEDGKQTELNPGDLDLQIASVSGSLEGAARVMCELEPRIELFIFDSAGPVLESALRLDGELVTNPIALTLGGSLQGSLKGPLTVFGKELSSVDVTIPELTKYTTLATGEK